MERAIFKISDAFAINSGIPGFGEYSRNGASLKNLKSRGTFLKIICFTLLTVFSGCSKDDDPHKANSLIGTWSWGTPTNVYWAYTFKVDGTGTFEENLAFISLKKNIAFKWTITGTKVTITNTESSYMATEMFFDSKAGLLYDVEKPNTKYRRRDK